MGMFHPQAPYHDRRQIVHSLIANQRAIVQHQSQLWVSPLFPSLQQHMPQIDFEHIMDYLRSTEPLSKVAFDSKLQVIAHALGTHTTVSRVQGSRLKSSREIRIATVFREAPAPFLKMIVVHELAHLKEADHNKAFYQLCQHMEPAYHQLELDLRLWLLCREQPDHGQQPATG